MPVHRIRLQGPWQVIPPGAAAGAPPKEVKLPASWRSLFGETAGTAIYQRSFNTPTNLTPEDRVLIRVPQETGEIRFVSLNGHELSADEVIPGGYDVSGLLERSNLLELQIEFTPASEAGETGGIWQPVALEIRSPQV